MHEINISLIAADADFLFWLLVLSLKSTLLIINAFAKCNLNSTAFCYYLEGTMRVLSFEKLYSAKPHIGSYINHGREMCDKKLPFRLQADIRRGAKG